MVSQRYRSQQTIGGKLLRLEKKTDEAQTSKNTPAEGAVGEKALATNAVTSDALAPNSVDSEALGPGAVGTENLGVVEQINSGTALTLNAPQGVGLQGFYTTPPAGTGYPLSLDSTGKMSQFGASTFAGTVQSTFVFGQYPAVLLDDGVTLVGSGGLPGSSVQWGGYVPVAGDRVLLGNSGSGVWYVLAKLPQYSPPVTAYMDAQNGFGRWNIQRTYEWDFYGSPQLKANMTMNGVVSVHGMLRSPTTGTTGPGVVIATLPVGMRPAWRMKLPISVNDSYGQVEIWTDGTIRTATNIGASNWVSFNNIYFTINPNLNWIPITNWGAGFQRWTGDTTNYPVPAYALDNENLVWFRGVVGTTTTVTGGNTMFTVPAGYRPMYNQHILGTGSGTFFYGRVYNASQGASAGKIDWGAMSTSYISLEGRAYYAETGSMSNWYNLQLFNSYANYTTDEVGSWAFAGFHRTATGFVLLKGLIKTGAPGVDAFYLPPDLRNGEERTIFQIPSNDAYARIDNWGETKMGAWQISNGSNAWYSLDNLRFIPQPYNTYSEYRW